MHNVCLPKEPSVQIMEKHLIKFQRRLVILTGTRGYNTTRITVDRNQGLQKKCEFEIGCINIDKALA